MTNNSQNDSITIDDVLLEVILDPVRSKILSLTHLYGEITQSDIEEKLKIKKSTVSHHLKKLAEKGLLSVSISPTGRPIKLYKLKNIYDIKLKLDRKKLLQLPIDLSSKRIIDYMMSIALQYRTFGDSAIESVNTLKLSQPFNNLEVDKDDNLIITIEGKKVQIPSFIMMVTGYDEAIYLRKRIFELVDDIRQKFLLDKKTNEKSDSISYLVNLAVFPFPRELLRKK